MWVCVLKISQHYQRYFLLITRQYQLLYNMNTYIQRCCYYYVKIVVQSTIIFSAPAHDYLKLEALRSLGRACQLQQCFFAFAHCEAQVGLYKANQDTWCYIRATKALIPFTAAQRPAEICSSCRCLNWITTLRFNGWWRWPILNWHFLDSTQHHIRG